MWPRLPMAFCIQIAFLLIYEMPTDSWGNASEATHGWKKVEKKRFTAIGVGGQYILARCERAVFLMQGSESRRHVSSHTTSSNASLHMAIYEGRRKELVLECSSGSPRMVSRNRTERVPMLASCCELSDINGSRK